MVEKGIQVVDVREPHEYADARIPGSVLVPLGMLLRSPRELLKPGPVLFICSEGIRSAVACEAAAAIGLAEIYNLEGGTGQWQAEGYPVESGAVADRVQAPGAPRARWFQVDFIIRMDPGATALLFTESVGVNSRQSFLVKQSGESSQRTIERGAPLLRIQKNGRHSLLVGIVAEERGESLRFVLKSSDGSISVTRIVRP